ncbi:uncharacterized protein [Rutidosis leptorrhynchoides]|uniref:uncharacterized protein n=1 Tax=Rutidosis leptorrhynchoides TaxID=125765 RepID=UPI003A9984EB
MVVDLGKKKCACGRWEITGMSCKHDVAAIWNFQANDSARGRPKYWVHDVYKLDTWHKTYMYTIMPVNSRDMWSKSVEPTTLVAPKKIATAGRPKKNRRKGFDEKESTSYNGKLSRKGKPVQCSGCKEFGHNVRGCKTNPHGIWKWY